MRHFSRVMTAQTVSEIVGQADIEARAVNLALKNVNIRKIHSLMAGLPSRSSLVVMPNPARLRLKATARQPSLSATLRAKAGGSGGARTRAETLQIKDLGGIASQGASQISGVLGHDLTRVVTAWVKLPAPLKAAILAIVSSAASQGGK